MCEATSLASVLGCVGVLEYRATASCLDYRATDLRKANVCGGQEMCEATSCIDRATVLRKAIVCEATSCIGRGTVLRKAIVC